MSFFSSAQRNCVIRLCLVTGIAVLVGCEATNAKKIKHVHAIDTTVNQQTAFVNLFLDSAAVQQFIYTQHLTENDSLLVESFYRMRNYEYAWFDSSGVAEQAYNFVNLYRNYRESVNDKSLELPLLDSVIEKFREDSTRFKPGTPEVINAEIMLSWQFFRYVQKAYGGNEEINPEDLGWFIPRKKIDPLLLLDSIVSNNGKDITGYLPVAPLFEQLRKALETYSKIETANHWTPILFTKEKYVAGDSASEIGLVKKRLQLLGDLGNDDAGNVLNEKTTAGINSYQQRMGLTTDGVLGKGFQQSINVPLKDRIRQILVNMERARWVPKPGKGPFIFVNIPEFKLHVMDSGKQQFEMAVVVGKPATTTVIFNGNMQYVVFAPYWNVPYSIAKNEMGRSASYFSKRNMEVVGHYSDGTPMVRQKPGPTNSLGRVKFLFPNSYSIYLHDTPSKGLFGQTTRAFSHGCIRIAEPEKMANWALRFNPEWTPEKIKEAMNASKEKTVTINNPIPVFVGYFTCWVGSNGKLNFRNDLYGHDQKLADHLFPADN